MKIIATDKNDGRVFELITTTPSWQMAKYILDNSDILFAKESMDLKAVGQMYDDILNGCVKKWREITGVKESKRPEIKWQTDNSRLPSTVVAGVANHLILMSKDVADIRIETEKK